MFVASSGKSQMGDNSPTEFGAGGVGADDGGPGGGDSGDCEFTFNCIIRGAATSRSLSAISS